jgi:hypothetical protein
MIGCITLIGPCPPRPEHQSTQGSSRTVLAQYSYSTRTVSHSGYHHLPQLMESLKNCMCFNMLAWNVLKRVLFFNIWAWRHWNTFRFLNIWVWNHWKTLCVSTFELEIIESIVVFNIWALNLWQAWFFNIWAWNDWKDIVFFNIWACNHWKTLSYSIVELELIKKT